MDNSLTTETNTLPAQSSGGLPPEVRSLIDLRKAAWQTFVEVYCTCGNSHTAALAAGYKPGSARQKGGQLLGVPVIKAAIARVRAALAERSKFGMDKAMAQLREDREFAISTENATAAVRATELMSKMAGHLIERIDARVQAIPFRIEIRGIDEPRQAIDGEAQEVSR